MAALTPKARALVQAARGALRASPADRERVEAALRAQLGPSALPDASRVPDPSALPAGTAIGRVVARGGWHIAAGALIGAGVIGGALLLALRPAEVSPVPRASAQPLTAPGAPAPPPAPRDRSSGAATPLDPSAVAPPPPVSARRETDRLAQEVALLSRATSALRSGRAAEALKALDEHQRLFPRGALSEERRAAKAQALCSLGRIHEGRAELARLAPQSPAAARAKQVCDSNGADAHADKSLGDSSRTLEHTEERSR